MKKIICIALTLLLTFSSVFCGFSTVSAADKDTLIIHPALFNRDSYRSTEDSRWYYSENRLETMPDLAVKTGDIVEVSFYMKAKSSEVTGVNSLHIMSFYSGTHEPISNYTTKQVYYSNEGYLHFTDQYYTNGDIAQVKEYGSTITMPSPNAASPNPLDTRSLEKLKHEIEYSDPTPFICAVEIALRTGMRIGEICGLRWQDVDPETGKETGEL